MVGGKKDDENVFIDSFTEGKIDVSDLSKLGKASTALQGAAIGHFLDEVQGMEGYGSADKKAREEAFFAAHESSLLTDGKIFGELVGDNTITKRIDFQTGKPSGGYQEVIYQYSTSHKFTLFQGATSVTKPTKININGVELPGEETIVTATGKLKSVKKSK